jgi:hypothetical protein
MVHMTKPLLLAASVLAAGCAAMSDPQCRGANWYDLGYRDGQYRLQSQASVYAQRCAVDGVKIDAARYEEGLLHGWYDFGDRWGIL